jgi:hypothetical protein
MHKYPADGRAQGQMESFGIDGQYQLPAQQGKDELRVFSGVLQWSSRPAALATDHYTTRMIQVVLVENSVQRSW